MQKLFILLAFIPFINCKAQQNQTWFKTCDSVNTNLCGYATEDGTITISTGKYDFCYSNEFNTIAFVKLKSKVWAINKQETLLFEIYCEKQQPDSPVDGIFRIVKNNKIGYANLEGEIIVPPKYDAGTAFINGMAFINVGCITNTEKNETFWKGGKWGAINLKGDVVIPIQYSNMNFLSQSNQEIKTPEIH